MRLMPRSRPSHERHRLVWLVMVAATTCAAAAQVPAPRSSTRQTVDGCWEFTLEMPEQRLHMLAEVIVAQDGLVTVTALGPIGGQEGRFVGRFAENTLALKLDLPAGVMDIALALEGDTLSGSWVGRSGKGNISARRVKEVKEGVTFSSLAEVAWRVINERFFDAQFNGVRWDDIKARYLPQARAARTNSDIVSVVRRMIGELKVSHLEFFIAPATAPVTYGSGTVAWRRLSPEQGYLRIRDFDAGNTTDSSGVLSSLRRALAELKDLPAMIVDLRGNRGGSITTTLQAVGCFLPAERTVLYAANRAGLANRHARSLDDIDLPSLPQARIGEGSVTAAVLRQGAVAIAAGGAPGGQAYEGRIALLIDERCVSGCELFAAILKESRQATLVGRQTGGEMLGADLIVFTKNMVIAKPPTRWRLRLPIIDFRTAGKKRLEGNGLAPDIPVSPEGSIDADLRRAMEVLAGRTP